MKEEIALRLDHPLLGLVEFCETYCVAGCCGVDAFEITEERIDQWVSENGVAATQQALEQLQGIVRDLSNRNFTVMSERLNACWPAQECVAWLERWAVTLDVVISKRK